MLLLSKISKNSSKTAMKKHFMCRLLITQVKLYLVSKRVKKKVLSIARLPMLLQPKEKTPKGRED